MKHLLLSSVSHLAFLAHVLADATLLEARDPWMRAPIKPGELLEP